MSNELRNQFLTKTSEQIASEEQAAAEAATAQADRESKERVLEILPHAPASWAGDSLGQLRQQDPQLAKVLEGISYASGSEPERFARPASPLSSTKGTER